MGDLTKTNEQARFTDAFLAELKEKPDVAPTLTAITERMGRGPRIGGRLTKLRIELLKEFGFRRESVRERWVK